MAPNIPTGWEEVSLDEIILSLDGGVSVKSGDGPALNGEKAVLKVSAVADGLFRPTENKILSEADGRLRPSMSVKAGDLIISRANTPELVGACGIARRDHPNLYLPDKLWKVTLRSPDRDSIEWLNFMLSSPLARVQLRARSSGTGRAMKNISKPSLLKLHVLRPPFSEQCTIVSMLGTYLAADSALRKVIEAKRRRLRGLMQQLLTGRWRLPSFAAQPWNQTRLRGVTSECTKRNGATPCVTRVMAVNKTHGLIPMRERTIADDLSRYKVVSPGAFAYNPMRLNIGSIARSHFDHDVLVSPDYVVFKCTECEPRYLDALRRSSLWRRHMGIAGNGSVRVRIYYDDLASMKVRLPSLPEQRAIADVLDTAQKEIDLLRQLRDQIQRQKRGLMQKLLTGEIPVPATRGKPARSKP